LTSDQFRYILSRYLLCGYLGNTDGMISVIFPGAALRRNARLVSRFASGIEFQTAGPEKIQLTIPAYAGQNRFVLRMMEMLRPITNDLCAAILHGSLATGEEIPYSDFDGVLILRNEVVQDRHRLAKFAARVIESRKIMMEMDPLQHHGWFILLERDLESYPENYLPHEIFKQACSLFPGDPCNLQLALQPGADYTRSFLRLSKSLGHKTKSDQGPQSVYALKNLLSEFMLLPAMYLQAKLNKGISKKLSFDLARADFPGETWSIMDEISSIRSSWKPEWNVMPGMKSAATGYLADKKRKRLKTAIPELLLPVCTPEFRKRMSGLVQSAKNNLHL